jgi:hypothetical protein
MCHAEITPGISYKHLFVPRDDHIPHSTTTATSIHAKAEEDKQE